MLSIMETSVDNQTLEDMSLIITHRMQSILSGIEGFAELLGDLVAGEEQRELVRRILEGTARLEYILQDLRFFSRPVQPLRLAVPVNELLIQLRMLLSEAQEYRLDVQCEEEQTFIRVDPRLFAQALMAVLQNAFEAHKAEEPVQLRVYKKGDAIYFDSWNRGYIQVPFAEERIFQPFFTTKAHNLGLGLAIARRIVRAHEGEIVLAQNHPEQGIIVRIQLPVSV